LKLSSFHGLVDRSVANGDGASFTKSNRNVYSMLSLFRGPG
jgi:hypothetical protein